MVLPVYPPLKCPNGEEIPQTYQTDGLLPSEIKKLCEETFSKITTAIVPEITTKTVEKIAENPTTATIVFAIGLAFLCFLIVFCIILTIRHRKSITCDNIWDCFTLMVGALFCCLCDKRIQRKKNHSEIEPNV